MALLPTIVRPSTDDVSTSPAPLRHAGIDGADGPSATRDRALTALAAERNRIERVVAELAAAALSEQSAEEDLGEIAAASQHPADVASETFEREVEFGLLDEFRTVLAEVDHAVARVADGTYGTCQRCGQHIATDRLHAVPATRWCLVCAEVAERDQRWTSPADRQRTAVLRDAEFLARDDELDADIGTERSSEEAAVTIRRVVNAD